MKKKNDLLKELTELIKDTKQNKLSWKIECSTTEYNPIEEKTVVEAEGKSWTVDECYVSYYCEWKGKEFLMITYEMVHTCEDKVKSTNLVFLPPLGIRYFDINLLMDYSVELDQVLAYQVHILWLLLLEKQKETPERVVFDVTPRQLVIE